MGLLFSFLHWQKASQHGCIPRSSNRNNTSVVWLEPPKWSLQKETFFYFLCLRVSLHFCFSSHQCYAIWSDFVVDSSSGVTINISLIILLLLGCMFSYYHWIPSLSWKFRLHRSYFAEFACYEVLDRNRVLFCS